MSICALTAHEAYGHAYFYELSRTNVYINPFHETFCRFVYIPQDGILVYKGDRNFHLVNQITKVPNEALYNFRKRCF